ncbi:MAG TPA: pitrilysin family protein [Polyangia bacterium]|nr:pitrilysin family protein [Polyangia bacterium]
MTVLLTTTALSAQAAPNRAAPNPQPAKAEPAEATPTAVPSKVTTVEGITEYHLPNGLRVLLFPDPTKPTVLVNVTYLVGSRVEGYGETGMAHLLEHMLFKGTPSRPEIWKLLQSKGANFNGSTWWDRTNYFEELPASQESLEFALALEADRMIHSKIAAEDLAKEFSVVRNEFEMGENNPANVLEDKMMATAFQWHNYGKSTIGSRSDIERVPVGSLRAFYRKYYQPDNAILIIAGKFDPAQALQLVSRHFGPIPRPTRILQPTWTVEPVQDGERQVTLRRTGDVALVSLVYHGVAGADPDRMTEDAIADILTNKPSGRLYKALVGKGLASEVSGNVYPMAEPGVIMLSAKVSAGVVPEKVRDIMTRIVEGLAGSKVTKEEVERWRAGWMKDFDLGLTETARTGVVLSEYAAMGDWRLLFLARDRVKAVAALDVERVARAYLKQSNRTLGLFWPDKTPDRAPLAQSPDVAALIKDYKGSATVAEGEAFLATVENVEKRTTRTDLADGLKLALLPKKTKGGSVRLVLTVRFGSEQDVKGKTTAAAVLPSMLMRGTKKHSFQQIKDQLDQLRAEADFGGGHSLSGTVNVSQMRAKTTRENLPAVLDLLGEILREPAFAKSELESLRKEMLARLEEQLQDPRANGQVALMQKLFPFAKDDVRYVPSVKESIERVRKLQAPELARMHKALWGMSAAQLAVVGDFDPATVKAQLEKNLGAWQSPSPYRRIALVYRANAPADETINTPDKEMAFVIMGSTLPVRDDDPAYPALTMLNYVLGGSPTSRLVDRLRQKEGLSYGAGSRIFAHPIDVSGHFLAWAICAPQNMDKSLAAMQEEIRKLVKDGIGEKDLDEAKKSYAKNWDSRMADDEFVSSELAQGLFLGRTFAYWRDLNDKIQKLTPAGINAVAKRFVKPDGLVMVRAGDLAKRK